MDMDSGKPRGVIVPLVRVRGTITSWSKLRQAIVTPLPLPAEAKRPQDPAVLVLEQRPLCLLGNTSDISAALYEMLPMRRIVVPTPSYATVLDDASDHSDLYEHPYYDTPFNTFPDQNCVAIEVRGSDSSRSNWSVLSDSCYSDDSDKLYMIPEGCQYATVKRRPEDERLSPSRFVGALHVRDDAVRVSDKVHRLPVPTLAALALNALLKKNVSEISFSYLF